MKEIPCTQEIWDKAIPFLLAVRDWLGADLETLKAIDSTNKQNKWDNGFWHNGTFFGFTFWPIPRKCYRNDYMVGYESVYLPVFYAYGAPDGWGRCRRFEMSLF